jgi:hypothetical protein
MQADKLKLDEETRWQIASEAVEELRRHGGRKERGSSNASTGTKLGPSR